MKKMFSLILAIVCMLGVLSVATPLTVNAAEGDVMVILQLKVDEEIGDKGSVVTLNLINTETREKHEVSFYNTSNYRTKFTVSAGEYRIYGCTVLNSTKDYEWERFTFKAEGQTVNVDFAIGKGNWEGSSDDEVLDGTIDRDKTDEKHEEQGKDPIDWDKVDGTVDDEFGEIITPDGPERPDDTTEPSEPEDTTEPSDKDDDTTVVPTEPSDPNGGSNDGNKTVSPIVSAIACVVVLGGCFGIIIYKRKKAGVPILPFGRKED